MYFYWFRSTFLAHTTFPIIHCVLSFIFLVSEQFFGKFFSIVTKLKSSVLSLLFYYLRKVINKHNKNKITHRLQDSMIFFDQLKAVEQRSWLNRRMLSFTIYCDTFQMYCPSCCLGILFQYPASQQYNFINSFSQTRWKLLKSTFLGHWRLYQWPIIRVSPQTSGFFGCRVFSLPHQDLTAVFLRTNSCIWEPVKVWMRTIPNRSISGKKQTVKSTVFIG